MSQWREGEAVDGAGLSLPKHCEHLSGLLALDPHQTAILVAELRNALVPEQVRPSGKGVERVLALADAIARRY